MLTEQQANELWYDALAAEARSLYFAELGARFTRQKQLITGVSFFLSSGAAATIIAHLPAWVPVLLASLTAALTAYAIGVGLDRKAATMAKLHYTWNQIESDQERIRSRWYEDKAEAALEDVELRAREASQLAITEAPYNESLLQKWTSYVNRQHGILAA